mgnify:CR=1 FL=1
MMVRLSELRCREVINICDGCRVGFIDDAEIDTTGGDVTALIVPGKARFFGLFGREDDYVIPWACIRRIGGDTILVEADLEKLRRSRKKKGFL